MILLAELGSGAQLWRDIVLLAIIQGITEFLPISSDGHIVMLADLLGRKLELADLTIILHMGTLLAIICYYWRRIWSLLVEDHRTILLLIVGTLPAVVVGLPLKKYGEHVLENPWLAAAMLPLTGIVLLLPSRHRVREGEYQKLSLGDALWIGTCQAVALLPGISRSGMTITSGLARGLSPRAAATFSFLLAIPAIAGAGLLSGISIWKKGGMTTPWPLLLGGAAISFIVGLASIWVLERVLVRGHLRWFAWWCIPVGIAFFCWTLANHFAT